MTLNSTDLAVIVTNLEVKSYITGVLKLCVCPLKCEIEALPVTLFCLSAVESISSLLSLFSTGRFFVHSASVTPLYCRLLHCRSVKISIIVV